MGAAPSSPDADDNHDDGHSQPLTTYDSKRLMVAGLVNEGQSCYVNATLQVGSPVSLQRCGRGRTLRYPHPCTVGIGSRGWLARLLRCLHH